MHDVFISYSTKDMSQALRIRDVLENNGIPCWMAPRDIPTGSNYAREIPVAIRACQVFVLVLSENAQASNWVVKELDNAVNCGKIIMPLMLEDCPLNDEFNFLLTGAQRYSAYQKSADVLNTLVEQIKAVLKTRAEHAPQPEAAPRANVKEAKATPPRQEAPRKAPAAPVVQQGKPRKPRKVKEKIPFTFGKVEALAALGIPGMALVCVLGYLLGNNLYMATTYPLQYGFGDIVLYSRDYQLLVVYAVLGMVIGAILWWEWIRFRHREQHNDPSSSACPACGNDRLRVSTFCTRRMTPQEWATLLLVPLCMVANRFIHPVVMNLILPLFDLRFLSTTNQIGTSIMISGLVQGLFVGLWLSNLLVRRLRRKNGLRSTVCRCGNCRATFLPVGK